MKQIELTQGQVSLVDDADYIWLNQWKWYAVNFRGHFYAAREEKGRHLYMSREILGLRQGDKRQADHINHNTLDNHRVNLRICTHQENTRNQKAYRGSSSQFRGVLWFNNSWKASIKTNEKSKYLGSFSNERDAAYAYDLAAIEYHKEFANLNFPNRDYTLPENRIVKRFIRKTKTSQYKGVCWFKPTKKWRANICINKKQMFLGYFDDEIEAAKTYDRAAIQAGGQFISYLNF